MEQKKERQEEVHSDGSVCCDGFPPLSPKFPWLFVQDQEDDQIFYNLHDRISKYQCRIPELVGKRIRGCFHGWLILTNHPRNNLWSLWNPSSTSDIISLPPLILKDGDYKSIQECCLSAPPDDPTSILLLTIDKKPSLIFYPLRYKRKKKLRNKPRWTEMSYLSQLKRIISKYCSEIVSLTCCNGKVFALSVDHIGTFKEEYVDIPAPTFVIWFDIVFKDREVLIKLSLVGLCPSPPFFDPCSKCMCFLKGSCTELLFIIASFDEETTGIKILGGVYPYKLDMTNIICEEIEHFKGLDMASMDWEELGSEELDDIEKTLEMWERMRDLKDATIFVDLAGNHLVFHTSPVASELGGYIHIREGKILYSYHVEDNTISLSSMPSLVLPPTSSVSLWECRLKDDHGAAKCTDYSKQKEDGVVTVTDNEVVAFNGSSRLLDIPDDILTIIMERCVGVEYMNFRTACKPCHLAASLIKWNNETSLRRLQNYSVVSPWLMVIDEIRGILTFTDPILGDKYHMKTSLVSDFEDEIYSSGYGWLLFRSNNLGRLVFFNPFTNDLRKLPRTRRCFGSACFTAPPTSPDCMVFVFIHEGVYIHSVAQERCWRLVSLGAAGPCSIEFPTFVGQYIYGYCDSKEELFVFKDLGQEHYSCEVVEAGAPRSCSYPAQYFLTSRDQNLLLVCVSKFGERVEVFKRTEKWEKIDCLGKHMVFISGKTCLCIEAKTPEMENKIYFPRLHSKNKRMVFYSLETCRYHTLYGKNIQEDFEDFLGTTTLHLSRPIWIEPSWS